MKIVITGSEGFVGREVKKTFKNESLFCLDNKLDNHTSLNKSNEKNLINFFKNLDDFFLIHCAASRNDFGLDFNDYFLNNVTATEILLNIIEKKKIKKFIHLSSVASIDGKVLKSKNKATTSPDEHYRLTKYLQENLIEKWAKKNEIPYAILAPSAIYDTETRLDTNIGKLKKYSKYIPFIPLIRVNKSLTSLSDLVYFIKCLVKKDYPQKKILCIDRPVKAVSNIIQDFQEIKKPIIFIPFFKQFIFMISIFLNFFSLGGKIDTKLTLGRFKKFYRDTSYSDQADYDESLFNDVLLETKGFKES
tara:strand:- start:2940 stop:3854 length:915 start_codon:yes stop_codon:yes gene_type:complete